MPPRPILKEKKKACFDALSTNQSNSASSTAEPSRALKDQKLVDAT